MSNTILSIAMSTSTKGAGPISLLCQVECSTKMPSVVGIMPA